MKHKLRFSPRAAQQLRRVAQYLEGERPGYGPKFLREARKVVDRIRENPFQFVAVPETDQQVRRGIVLTFGYWIIFEVDDDQVTVLSIWHGRQAPDDWR